VEAVDSGKPKRMVNGAKNVTDCRTLAKVGFSRRLWK
jgi:hypothetical protein